MTNFLLKTFAAKKGGTKRERYGSVAGVIGIISNALISVIKLSVGLAISNIAIIADGINNLADTAGSIITVVGFRISSKPADKEHPYGHARMEYISALGVSFIVLFLGLQLLVESINGIIAPKQTEFGTATILLLVFSVGVKIWQRHFFSKTAAIINSKVLKAAAIDSRNDIIMSIVVLLSLPISSEIGFSLEGYVGVLVSLFILYSGIQLIGDTVTPLLGAPPDKGMIDGISEKILSTNKVLGMHDLIVHNYGVGRYFASVHVEMSADNDLLHSHEIIDAIEREVGEEFDVTLVIHLDPVVKDERVNDLKEQVLTILRRMSNSINIHDFRAVFGPSKVKLIFDVEVPASLEQSDGELRELMAESIKLEIPHSASVIFIDRLFD